MKAHTSADPLHVTIWLGLYFFLLSNPTTIYHPRTTLFHPVPRRYLDSFLSIFCFYCSSSYLVSYLSVDILNAPFQLLLFVLYDLRSCVDTLSHRPSFVDVPRVYKETPP